MVKPKNTESLKRLRLHKRTIVVVLCSVVLPWILIAIPRTTVSSGGSSMSSSSHRFHGWPFVHLESTKYSFSSGWLKMNPGKVPPKLLDLDKQAQEFAARYVEKSNAIQLNLRHRELSSWEAEYIGQSGYWSNSSNWPWWREGTYLTARYAGAVLNLICVALLAAVVAALCEYRIRRIGGLLKFSLANLIVGLSLLGVVFAWIAYSHREYDAQMRRNNALQMLDDGPYKGLLGFQAHYEGRFPLVVSQLFNHGVHPWGAVPFFRRVKSGRMNVRVEEGTDWEDIKQIKTLAEQTQYVVDLEVLEFNPERQRMLNAFADTEVRSLHVDFDAYDWLSEEFGDDHLKWERRLERSGFKVDLGIDLSGVEEIWLELDETISQAEQLHSFLSLPALKEATFSGLSTEGARFILENKTRWPKAMEFDFLDNVPEELKQELESEFDAELIGGVF